MSTYQASPLLHPWSSMVPPPWGKNSSPPSAPQGPASPAPVPPCPPLAHSAPDTGASLLFFQHTRYSPAPGPLHGLFSPHEMTFLRPLQGLLPCFSQYLVQTSTHQISCSPDHLTPDCPPNSRPLSPPSGFVFQHWAHLVPVYHLSISPVTGHQVCPVTCRAVWSAQGSIPQRGRGA